MPFSLESVNKISLETVRVRFTEGPLTSDPLGANDALNPDNYSLSGPVAGTVLLVSEVAGDSQAVDLTVAPLSIGVWTLTCHDVQSVGGGELTEPASLSFSVDQSQESLVAGARNDSAFDIIYRHSNPTVLKGRVWSALRHALAVGDAIVWENARLAFDQLFKCTASGIYLDRKCSDDGVGRPQGIGMPDDLFRGYAIKSTNQKLTQQSLLRILEVFYGADAVRGYVETSVAEPYVLTAGWSIDILLDEKDLVRVVFSQDDFVQLKQARAIEVAAAITRAIRNQRKTGYAVAITDPTTGTNKVRIYSGTLGLGSSARVKDGYAQFALQFPSFLDVYPLPVTSAAPITWDVTYPTAGTTRFSTTAVDVSSAQVDLGLVREGDSVFLYDPELGLGSSIHTVTQVQTLHTPGGFLQSFDLDAALAFPPGAYSQTAESGLRFFRSTKQTTQSFTSRAVTVCQSTPSKLKVSLPATTRAVGRGMGTASYLKQSQILDVFSFERVDNALTVVTTAEHGLQAGNVVLLDALVSDVSFPAIASASDGSCAYSKGSLWSEVWPPAVLRPKSRGNTLTLTESGLIVRLGGYYQDAGFNYIAIASGDVLEVVGNQPDGYSYTWSNDTLEITHLGAPSPRANHSAVLLPSGIRKGMIWVAGGQNGDGQLNAHYLNTSAVLDCATWAWHDGPDLSVERSQHTATVLTNGKVLLTGGLTGPNTESATCDLYDPDTNTISAASSMNVARRDHDAVILDDGRVLVAGGRSGATTAATCEVYDPGTDTWEITGVMTSGRYGLRLLKLDNGRVLAIGGYKAATPVRSVEMWEPETGRWHLVCNLPYTRYKPATAIVHSINKVVIAFGGDYHTDYIDLSTLAWKQGPTYETTGELDGILYGDSFVYLPEQELLFAYGNDPGDNAPVADAGASAIFIPGVHGASGGGLNGQFKVEAVPSPVSFVVSCPNHKDYSSGRGGTAAKVTAQIGSDQGPYLFDPHVAPAVTAIESQTTQSLVAGQQYRSLDLVDGSSFPDAEGWLCLGFGTQNQTFPVRYIGKLSANTLLLDYQFTVPYDLDAGASVILLKEKGAYVPQNTLGLYLTASPAGRVAAVKALHENMASGTDATIEIIYPGDKGLGGAGLPATGTKISDKVAVWGGDDVDGEVAIARGENE